MIFTTLYFLRLTHGLLFIWGGNVRLCGTKRYIFQNHMSVRTYIRGRQVISFPPPTSKRTPKNPNQIRVKVESCLNLNFAKFKHSNVKQG